MARPVARPKKPKRNPKREAAASAADGPAVEFTRTEKVFYPKVRFTKGDVIKYYLEIAPVLLPHFKGRPVTLKRYPDGIHGQFFYEKDAPGYTPAWVPTFPVQRREGGEPIHYILIENARVLAWCANLATVELHPFLHRVPAIDVPTAVAFDLDPGEGAGLPECARVALELRDVFAELHLDCWPKVSGSKGLQLYVPLNTPTTYPQTQAFAKAIAELMHRKHPQRIVNEMAKELRRGKVFIDWSQNSDFKTTVGVYSLRAKREEPYVSMPVAWDEVAAATKSRGAAALNFSPAAALARVAKLGDLFAPVLTKEQVLPATFVEAVNGKAQRSPRVAPGSVRGVASPRAARPAVSRLAAYEAKRDFGRTPEPDATAPRRSAQGSRRRFVIQKHAASHLHYDFRLEMNDTLRSWAVPKGLPYALDERHSAFATEDHPLAYLMFEGIIPQGQYGGGTVMVWDAGTYDVIDGNYWKGFLRVYLRGKKLKGEWTLTRVEERDGKARWLIVKAGEPVKPISAKRDDQSAISKRTMAEIAAARDAVWESNREEEFGGGTEGRGRLAGCRPTASVPTGPNGAATPSSPTKRDEGVASPSQLRAARRSARTSKRRHRLPTRPEFIEPMMARSTSALPHGADWLYEVKWDGYRALAIKYGDVVDLLSRKGNSLAADFPTVVDAVRQLPADVAMLDGEIVALDEQGRPQFQLLQNRRAATAQIVFYAYDLLQVEADDVKRSPLEERKARLATLVENTAVRFSANLPGEPEQILAQAHALGLEGIVAKRRGSPYESGERSGAWLKMKLSPEQEFVIGGYKPGKPLESLLVGYYEGKKLMFAGKVRQGLNSQNRAELWRVLQPLLTDRCPFANIPNSKKSHFGEGVTPEQMKELKWAKPKLVAQISFAEWTVSGNLRHATFLGLRQDKDAKHVVRELPG